MFTMHEGYQKLLGLDITGMPNRIIGAANATPMKELLDLTGKVAIVSGGAMGMGFCAANRLCEAGASVVVADVADEYADKNLEFLKSKGYKVKYCKTDVSNVEQIKAAVDFTVEEFGGVDILVNNASVWSHRTLSEISKESLKEIVDVNLNGTLFFTQAVVDVMEKQGRGGKIINVASVAGLSEDPGPVMFEYVASKSAVIALTKSLVRALQPLKINVNCVIPGGMMTPGAMLTQATEAALEIRKTLKSPPIGDPDHVARVVFMMATQISDYMHGAEIIADGGACCGI
ncbi:SDR family NAD(P)-dependent oxidoreductase [Alkalibacter mobilis]|uniref:SDR family NAD(P)-dependent oxidoreductase n=1 Tax=Alkalibacter mobilis TaxID=2787712 RepID=UPI00189E1659|nr:SDR family oxidoreductase [Alkalibacter mobilis]MBF7096830.1 SDR family oxidoreductase [Alkalibacter mobilis]